MLLVKSHLKHAFHVLRYLKGSLGTEISFKHRNSLNLSAFVDSDWAKCKVTIKYVTGYVIYLGNNRVSWKRKKQTVLAKSLAEAKCRAKNSVTCEVLWIIKILNDLRVDVNLPVPLSCDRAMLFKLLENVEGCTVSSLGSVKP
nr:ribonuclease H-like domain-containing protein [Tanacetum cinerariifolium]